MTLPAHASAVLTDADTTASAGVRWPRFWLLLATLAVCAMAAWQRAPAWPMLLLALAATIAAALTLRTVRTPRAWAGGAVVALFIAVGFGVQETRTLENIQKDSARWLNDERTERATRVAARIRELQQLLTEAASKAVEQAEAASDGVVPALTLPVSGRTETAVVLFRDGHLVAHAGQSRVPLDTAPEGLSLVHSPFYTAMVAHARGGVFQASAVALLASAPPADRFTQSLVQELAQGRQPNVVEILPASATTPTRDSSERDVNYGVAAFARVIATPRLLGEALVTAREHARIRTSIPLAIAALLMLVTSWRRPARTRERLAMVFSLLVVVALVPLGSLSNRSGVFDPTNYYSPMGGRLTGNVAALIATASLVLCALFLVLRSPKLLYPRRVALLAVVLLAGAGPFVLRDLARGIHLSSIGPSTKLWVAWQLSIALAGASVLVAGASAGQVAIGSRRGLPSWLAPLIAGFASVLAIPMWNANGSWPAWYPVLWILAIALLAFVRRGPALIVGAALVAGFGAVTLTWGANVRASMIAGMLDVAQLATADNDAIPLLKMFADDLRADSIPLKNADELVRAFAASGLAQAQYSVRISRWTLARPNTPEVDVRLATVTDTSHFQRDAAMVARLSGRVEVRAFQNGPISILTAAIPFTNGDVITVAVPPLNYLGAVDPFETLTGLAIRARSEPTYRLTYSAGENARAVPFTTVPPNSPQGPRVVWRRGGDTMHGDVVSASGQQLPVHLEVDMRGMAALVPRGALLVLFDLAIVIMLWAASAMSDGALWRWLRQRARQWSRSYRIRLSFALLAFFAVPAAAFAGWAAYRLREDDRSARELIVRDALRIAAVEPTQYSLEQISNDVGASLYLYRDGQLTAASYDVLDLLSPIGRLLPRTLFSETSNGGDAEDFSALTIPTGSTAALVGYRRVRLVRDAEFGTDTSARTEAVVATPARGNEFELDERRADLAVQVLFALSIGALAALWLSGVAARTLARPVGTLREAALALAAGQRALKLSESPAEFVPVFSAFGQMAGDLSASRDALEAAQRRTEAVLQHVASGVLAVNPDGGIIIANPRAESMLGVTLKAGTPVASFAGTPTLSPLFARVTAFLSKQDDDASFVITLKSRQLNARLTRLPAGAVLTLDDVTELASAQRVLAWGEMARQVAHEIKNPLTPIRLGVQHVRRAFRDGRGDFSEILEKNVGRVLEEIDHLDEIARAFSRYGTAPAERDPPQLVSLGVVVRTVLALESLGESGVTWTFKSTVDETADEAWARADELKEVLLNLLENARLAHATTVEVQLDAVGDLLRICVVDNGAGMAPDVLPRIFEPHFSTRTSGSGLGLAISRRLIEGWGGTVDVSSEVERGTTVRILLRGAFSATRTGSPG